MTLAPSGATEKRLIKQDYFSLVFSLSAATILTQFSTFGGDLAYPVVIGLILILTGFIFSLALQFLKVTPVEKPQQQLNIGVWAFLLLFAFVVAGYIVPQIQFSTQSIVSYQAFYSKATFNLTTEFTGAFIFIAILIPAAEEQFFRGLWGNFFLVSLSRWPFLAPLLGGAIFAIFHLAVYGLNYYTLGILFISGATMISVDAYATGSITSSIIAHSLNNALSFGVGAGIVTGFLPHAVVPLAPLALLVVPSVTIFRAYRAGKVSLTWRVSLIR